MLNNGKTDIGTKINVGSNYVLIHPCTIQTGTITVRDSGGGILWQKYNATYVDISFAIEVARRDIVTNFTHT